MILAFELESGEADEETAVDWGVLTPSVVVVFSEEVDEMCDEAGCEAALVGIELCKVDECVVDPVDFWLL